MNPLLLLKYIILKIRQNVSSHNYCFCFPIIYSLSSLWLHCLDSRPPNNSHHPPFPHSPNYILILLLWTLSLDVHFPKKSFLTSKDWIVWSSYEFQRTLSLHLSEHLSHLFALPITYLPITLDSRVLNT